MQSEDNSKSRVKNQANEFVKLKDSRIDNQEQKCENMLERITVKEKDGGASWNIVMRQCTIPTTTKQSTDYKSTLNQNKVNGNILQNLREF